MSAVSLALSAGNVAARSIQPSVAYLARAMSIQKAHQIALGTMVIVAIAELPTVKAGPIAEITCMAACAAAAFTGWGAIFYPNCMMACALLGFAPTP